MDDVHASVVSSVALKGNEEMNATLHYECICGKKEDVLTDRWSRADVPAPPGWLGFSSPGEPYGSACSVECLAKIIGTTLAAAALDTRSINFSFSTIRP